MRTTPISAGMGAQPSVIRAYCFNTDLPGHAVRVLGDRVGGLYQVTKVDIDSSDPVESIAVGVIAAKMSSSTCMVMLTGPLTGVYNGLPFGRLLFSGTDAYLSITRPARPATGGRIVQPIAHAIASNVVLVNPGQPTLLVAA